jgi:hypothetical protein
MVKGLRNMNNRPIRSVRLEPSAPRFCAAGAALVILTAIWAPSAVTAATPNVCHITGITRIAAKKVFPKLDSVSASQTQAPTTPPTSASATFGHGAFYSPVKGDKNDATLLFKRGAYTVLIDPTRIGGTSADYPTENQYLTLARAIYTHLG